MNWRFQECRHGLWSGELFDGQRVYRTRPSSILEATSVIVTAPTLEGAQREAADTMKRLGLSA